MCRTRRRSRALYLMKRQQRLTHITMHEKTDTGHAQHNGNGAEHSTAAERNGSSAQRDPQQDLVYRLKTAIDQRGRYSFRLDDMAAGYAAGQGISASNARRAIEERFTAQFGHSPHEYLEQHYAERREEKDRSSLDRAPESSRGGEMER